VNTLAFAQVLAQIEPSFGGIISIAIFCLQVAVIVSIIAGSGTTQHKLLWSLLVLLLPVVGLILYFIIGRSRRDRPFLE